MTSQVDGSASSSGLFGCCGGAALPAVKDDAGRLRSPAEHVFLLSFLQGGQERQKDMHTVINRQTLRGRLDAEVKIWAQSEPGAEAESGFPMATRSVPAARRSGESAALAGRFGITGLDSPVPC